LKRKVLLFISSFRKNSKKILVIFAFCIVFLVIERMVSMFLEPPQRFYSDYDPRISWDDFYHSKRNVDIIFLGSSHCNRSFDPEYFDNELGLYSFNLGSSCQSPTQSYYVLQEAIRYNNPKFIVMEVYWVMFEQDTNFNAACYIFDNIRFSPNKLSMLYNDFSPDQYLKAMFYSIRYHDNYKNTELIKENLYDRILKKNPVENKFISNPEIQFYKNKGFVANTTVASTDSLRKTNFYLSYKSSKWSNKQIVYFNKIIQLCKKNDMEIIFVTTPLPPTSLSMIENYNSIHKAFQEIADYNQINYIDYNVINNELKIFNDQHFMDEQHLNLEGVMVLNKNFAQALKPLLQQ